MDKQPSSIANFVEPGPESIRLRAARVRVELNVGTGSQRHSFYQGFADELSAVGIFVGTYVKKPIGDELDISIQLPDSEQPIVGTCQVSWLREPGENSDTGPGLGLKFLELSVGAQQKIAEFLKQEQALFHDE